MPGGLEYLVTVGQILPWHIRWAYRSLISVDVSTPCFSAVAVREKLDRYSYVKFSPCQPDKGVVSLISHFVNQCDIWPSECIFIQTLCRKTFREKSGFVVNEESKKVAGNLKSDVEIFILLEKNQEYADAFHFITNHGRHLMSEYVDSNHQDYIWVGYSNLSGRFGIVSANCVIAVTNSFEGNRL
jgi:hypothetical protein